MATTLPSHLPRRLAICYYGWDWIVSTRPEDAYADLERAMRETKERGFNCVRPDMGLMVLYDQSGRPRGEVAFRGRLVGANDNMNCFNTLGGVVHDVRARVLRLFELAETYDLYVIGTSWMYQDFLTEVADPTLREEIVSVPYNERLTALARQWDWLVCDLKDHGLAHRLAFAELINEMGWPPVSCTDPAARPQTFEEWVAGHYPPTDSALTRDLASEALAFLQDRHPDVLFTVDLGHARLFPDLLPENAQVADHHVYTDGVAQGILRAAGVPAWGVGQWPEGGPDLETNETLRSLLRPDPMPWDEVVRRGEGTHPHWIALAWFYQNVDMEKYDRWCIDHFDEFRSRIEASAREACEMAAAYAKPRGLPMVVDEGFILYPPLRSRFVTTPQGRWGEEIGVEAAIATGHWGTLPTGYFRPNTPVWYDEDQCAWVAGLNRRILES